ncbi:MAG: esterase family protein, partial [Bacteroidia bacterium]|nr:esterase family protein [Bacteroidia bacterium]
MKQLMLIIIYLFVSLGSLYAQRTEKGTILVEEFLAPSIQGNSGGEDPMRQVTIYLPSGYEDNKQHYPVLYFLHGFTVDDSFYMSTYRLNELLDEAIASGHIRPMILVLPNSDTKFKGSFYTNTQINGKWADYISRDVVAFIDKKFRTIPNKNSRGLAGHSMGGNGAIKIEMTNSNVFGAVYA